MLSMKFRAILGTQSRSLGLTWILENCTMIGWHQGTLLWLVGPLEVIANVFHLNPLDTLFTADVFDQPINY